MEKIADHLELFWEKILVLDLKYGSCSKDKKLCLYIKMITLLQIQNQNRKTSLKDDADVT